jgi:tetratricopeptide (TPR) repeat protein
VVLSYFPDVVEQLAGYGGWRSASAFSHSLLFALVAGVVLAPVLARVGGARLGPSAAIAVLAILAHDALDILQSPDRMPAWPISTWRFSGAAGVIPSSLLGEVAVLSPLVIFIGLRRWSRRRANPPVPVRPAEALAWSIVAAIVASAAVVSHLRDVRHDELLHARALVAQGDYVRALAACDRADRWPATVAPGRLDYVRAEAWLGLGNRDRAEKYYLSSRRGDPTYFWTVADLAVMYASGEKPLDQRRREAAPWVHVLETDFAGHPALPRTLARVQRNLRNGG